MDVSWNRSTTGSFTRWPGRRCKRNRVRPALRSVHALTAAFAREQLSHFRLGAYLAACLWLFAPFVRAQDAQQQLFDQITDKARNLAAQPFEPPRTKLPQAVADLNYDQYRDIRFRSERALWRGQALFEIQFFHPGFLYRERVTVHTVDNGAVQTVPFESGLFDYGATADIKPEQIPKDLGFAGFRIHYPLNRADYKDEVIVFLGASYLRVVGRDQSYGLSARGLAVDTGLPKGEEFPRFREFWLVRPAPQATAMTLYALLDGNSVTGAYRFRLRPGADTIVGVEARLFARADVAKLGVAPMSSMFLHGENRVAFFDDYRPEVHDSDGLLMQTGSGEWIWRPLKNPRKLQVTALLDQNPQGFGLAQRDRDFAHYLDMETRYDTHPSLWVRPHGGDWGKGAVQLIEIPADREIDDNIAAFWVPDAPFKAGQERTYAYELATFGARLRSERLAQVQRTRIGWGAVPGSKPKPPRSLRQFIVDFRGGELPSLSAAEPLKSELSTSSGKIADLALQRLPDGQAWRVAFKLAPTGDEPVDMRLFLALRGHPLSETWSYVWYPDAVK